MPDPIDPFASRFTPDDHQHAIAHRIGALTDIYPAKPFLEGIGGVIAWFALLAPFVLALIIIITISIIEIIKGFLQNMDYSYLLPIFLFLLLYTIPAVFLIMTFHLYRLSKSHLLIGSEGLIYLEWKRTTVIHWPEIKYIKMRSGSPEGQGMSHYCHLRLTNGKIFKLGNHLQNYAHLSRTIARRVTRAQMPHLFSAYHAGQTLSFGSLSLSKRGLHKGKESLAWDQFTMLYVYEGVVTVEQEGKHRLWPLVRVSRIQDFFSFIALIHLITDGRIRYEPPDPS